MTKGSLQDIPEPIVSMAAEDLDMEGSRGNKVHAVARHVFFRVSALSQVQVGHQSPSSNR